MKEIRCAIYTRKSSEEGLELEFNSLDAQREACEAYIKSQKHEGWVLVDKQYNDGGFSGGTLNRPAFQEILKDTEKGLIDIVVVYKVDRLTRSLMDFAKIIEVFDKHNTSFVSITQQFNTTTSMGRLTLNMLLSFAQFEREVTSERLRDKFAASKKKGMWVNGVPPIGYKKKDNSLEIVEAEANTIKIIFEKYLELGTVRELLNYLKNNNVKTRNDKFFSKGHLYKILSCKTYTGKIEHKGNIYEGLHEPIISREVFDKVQKLLVKNALIRKNELNAKSASLLQGLLFDDNGNYMSPTHSNKKGKRYRYYVSQAPIQEKFDEIGSVSKISAGEIENFVTQKIKEYVSNKNILQKLIAQYSIQEQKIILDYMKNILIDTNFIRHALIKTIISKDYVKIYLSRKTLLESIQYLVFKTDLPIKHGYERSDLIELSSNIRISGTTKNGSKLIIGETNQKCLNQTLVNAIAKSFYYHKLMFENKLTSKQKASTYIHRIMQLRFLPKDLIVAILNGEQTPDLTLDKLFAYT